MPAVLRTLLAWFTSGSALATLASVVIAICALILGLLYRRYLGILGGDRRRPAERRAYDALRNSLAEGNKAARLYAERLTRFLDWIDRFVDDAGKADQTLFPRAFGLRSPAPTWTAPSFDRCLLLALLYPILTILVTWAVSGHVGPAESALQLTADVPGWQRAAGAAGVGWMLFVWQTTPRGGTGRFWRNLIFSSGCMLAFWVLIYVGGLVAFIFTVLLVALSGEVASAAGTSSVLGAVAFSVLIGLFDAPSDFTAGFAGVAFTAGITTAVLLIAIAWVGRKATARRWQGKFLFIFLPAMILTCLADANLLSSLEAWAKIGPTLLFLGLLTLLNAPFDWFSLGLTRALLRRGLELRGWWPFSLGLADAGLAAVITAALGIAMTVGVQAFDALAERRGGAPVLPLEPLFNGIAAQPAAPEYWWLYALLLSTMIPSLVNLVIGGTSFLRGLPGVPSLLLKFIPAQGNVPKFDRAWIATVLTLQVAAGTTPWGSRHRCYSQ
jgi:hypothetical protein